MTAVDVEPPAPAAAAPKMTPGRTTAICAAMVALGPLAMALYTPAMPAISAGMGVASEAVKMTLTAYFAGFALSQLVAGPLSDAMGRKATLFVFFTLFAAATLWAISAEDIEHLIAARALQGAGASAGIAVSRAIVRDMFNLIGIPVTCKRVTGNLLDHKHGRVLVPAKRVTISRMCVFIRALSLDLPVNTHSDVVVYVADIHRIIFNVFQREACVILPPAAHSIKLVDELTG